MIVLQVGMVVNKTKYCMSDYVEAVLITLGVIIFSVSEKNNKMSDVHEDTMFGVFLLAIYLMCDSFTSQWQSKVYKHYSVDQYQMMLGVNIWSMILTGFALYHSGEFVSSVAFVLSDSTACIHMMVLSITSAIGQLFIFYTIKEFGPMIFTVMMTTRQIFSLCISCLTFGHALHVIGWISSVLVFAVVFNRIYWKGSD